MHSKEGTKRGFDPTQPMTLGAAFSVVKKRNDASPCYRHDTRSGGTPRAASRARMASACRRLVMIKCP
jgi:hypothetical protein